MLIISVIFSISIFAKCVTSVPSWLGDTAQLACKKWTPFFSKMYCSKAIIMLFFVVHELFDGNFTTLWKVYIGVPFFTDICFINVYECLLDVYFLMSLCLWKRDSNLKTFKWVIFGCIYKFYKCYSFEGSHIFIKK